MGNIFDMHEKTMQGQVVLTQRPSPLVEGKDVLHVVRNVADDAALVTEMTKHTDVLRFNDLSVVMSAFVASVKEIISSGNAVRVSGVGTIYLTAAEGGDGTVQFGVGFTPDKGLVDAAQKAQVQKVLKTDSAPVITSVENMETREQGGALDADGWAMLRGSRLRVAGDASETGVFFAPCDGNGRYKADMSDWVRCNSKFIVRNLMREILFRLPPAIKGQYRIAVVTRSPINGSKGKEHLLKNARVGVSEMLTVRG